LNDLIDGLSQSDAGLTHFSLAEVVAPCLEMIIFNLSVLEGEVPGSMLACEVMTVRMLVSSSVRAGIRHLGVEIMVVAWYAAPSGGLCGAEEVWGFTMGGDVVVPRAI
jgi:hypothetical protein